MTHKNMIKLNDVYKCSVCGNMVGVIRAGGGQLVCCGQPMELQKENSTDATQEKHVPVVEIVGDKVIVKIGVVEHPMTAEHRIEWVEVLTAARSYRKHFTPGEKPFAEFKLEEEIISVRAYCNLHGLWRNE
jgi:superoxide reductase